MKTLSIIRSILAPEMKHSGVEWNFSLRLLEKIREDIYKSSLLKTGVQEEGVQEFIYTLLRLHLSYVGHLGS
jgi:hypothetical protein